MDKISDMIQGLTLLQEKYGDINLTFLFSPMHPDAIDVDEIGDYELHCHIPLRIDKIGRRIIELPSVKEKINYEKKCYAISMNLCDCGI